MSEQRAEYSLMSPQAIFEKMVNIFPDFAAYWNSTENCFRQKDGSFTFCGVFSEFSHFFREACDQISAAQRADLGRFISECLKFRDTELNDAPASCFLENVSFEPCSAEFVSHLSGDALKFYRQFNNQP